MAQARGQSEAPESRCQRVDLESMGFILARLSKP